MAWVSCDLRSACDPHEQHALVCVFDPARPVPWYISLPAGGGAVLRLEPVAHGLASGPGSYGIYRLDRPTQAGTVLETCDCPVRAAGRLLQLSGGCEPAPDAVGPGRVAVVRLGAADCDGRAFQRAVRAIHDGQRQGRGPRLEEGGVFEVVPASTAMNEQAGDMVATLAPFFGYRIRLAPQTPVSADVLAAWVEGLASVMAEIPLLELALAVRCAALGLVAEMERLAHGVHVVVQSSIRGDRSELRLEHWADPVQSPREHLCCDLVLEGEAEHEGAEPEDGRDLGPRDKAMAAVAAALFVPALGHHLGMRLCVGAGESRAPSARGLAMAGACAGHIQHRCHADYQLSIGVGAAHATSASPGLDPFAWDLSSLETQDEDGHTEEHDDWGSLTWTDSTASSAGGPTGCPAQADTDAFLEHVVRGLLCLGLHKPPAREADDLVDWAKSDTASLALVLRTRKERRLRGSDAATGAGSPVDRPPRPSGCLAPSGSSGQHARAADAMPAPGARTNARVCASVSLGACSE